MMRFPDRVRLPIRFDAVALEADLTRLAGDPWTPHFVRQNYEGEWSAMPIRAPAGAEHPILMIAGHPGVTEFVDAPALSRAPAVAEVLGALRCELRLVRLMRLAPGAAIRPHRDPGMSAEEGEVRLHLPVLTNAGVAFLVNGRQVPMAAGELWYLRLSDPHEVRNAGAEERVHLVIDAVMNQWLAVQLEAGDGGGDAVHG